MKDGQELVHDGQNVIIKQEGGNHTLTVNNAKRSDSGKYTCVITNPFGVQEEASDVHIRCKPEFTEPLTDQEVRVGSKDLAFTAKASVYPPPKVRWFLDEVEITEERAEYTIKSDDATGTYSLIAPEVTANMSGKYTIQLENDLGSAKSSAILTLQCKFLHFYSIFSELKEISLKQVLLGLSNRLKTRWWTKAKMLCSLSSVSPSRNRP